MKFLVDAQLPPSLAALLREQGHDAIHTESLPEGNFATDATIIDICVKEGRILLSKDSDFYHTFVLKPKPYKLLLVRTGNVQKGKLNELILENIGTILAYFREGSLVEITTRSIKLLK